MRYWQSTGLRTSFFCVSSALVSPAAKLYRGVKAEVRKKSCLSCVARDEVVHGLLFAEAGNGRQHSKGIAAEQDEVLGMGSNAGNPGVVDVVNGVRSPGVFRHSTADSTYMFSRSALMWLHRKLAVLRTLWEQGRKAMRSFL